MDEESVLIALAEELDDEGVQFFVDVNGYEDADGNIAELTERLEHCGRNDTIRIGRRTPDILGYEDDGEIFAIEVKGDKKIRQGIGQAAHYQIGVHRSYVAADESAVAEFASTVLACDLGLYEVSKNREVDHTRPNQVVTSAELDKTRRALSVKTSDFEADRSAFSSSTMPLNAFLPLVFTVEEGKEGVITRDDCQALIADHDHGVRRSTSNHAVALARTLQLLEQFNDGESKLRVTETGRMGYYTLLGRVENIHRFAMGIDPNAAPETDLDRTLWYIKRLKDKRQKVYELDPSIGKFLRDRYAAVPNVRQMVNVLAQYPGTEAELPRILAEIALEVPDTYLALFVKQDSTTEFSDIVEQSNSDPTDRWFQDELVRIASGDYLYNFVSQLCHVGILTAETDVKHQSDEFRRGEFGWVWDRDIVGDFGTVPV